MYTLIQDIALTLTALLNCRKTANRAKLVEFARDRLPRGAGLDKGTEIDIVASTPERIVLTTSFHHMDQDGGYNGWTDHEIIVTPSLGFGFNLRITGYNRNDIKPYLQDLFQETLSSEENK